MAAPETTMTPPVNKGTKFNSGFHLGGHLFFLHVFRARPGRAEQSPSLSPSPSGAEPAKPSRAQPSRAVPCRAETAQTKVSKQTTPSYQVFNYQVSLYSSPGFPIAPWVA